MSPRVVLAWCLGAIFVVSAIVGQAMHQSRWLHAADDQMYTFALAARFFTPAQFSAASLSFREFMQERAETPELIERYDLRDRYRDNYIGASRLTHWTAEVIRAWAPAEAQSFARWSALTMTLSAMLTSAVAVLAVLIGLIMTRDMRLLAAVAVMGVVTLYEGTIALGVSHRLLPDAPGVLVDPFDVVSRAVRLFVDPGDATFLFGASPRCAFSLLLLAAFLFRWQGRPAAGYWLFVPMTLLHQSQTGIFLAMVVALDLILRPRSLARPGVFLAIATALAIFLLRERLWSLIGLVGLVAATIAVAAVTIGVFIGRQWLATLNDRLVAAADQMLRRLRALPLPTADAILLAIGWLGLLIVTAVGNYFASPEQSTYFWNHIAGRILGIIRTEILVAFVYAGLGALGKTRARGWAAPGTAALAFLLLPLVYRGWPPTSFSNVVARNAAAMAELDARLLRPLPRVSGADENLIYYGLAKRMATGVDPLQTLR